MRQCFGRKPGGQRCRQKIASGLFCIHHRHHRSRWAAYLVFTVLGGLASIGSYVLAVGDRESLATSLEAAVAAAIQQELQEAVDPIAPVVVNVGPVVVTTEERVTQLVAGSPFHAVNLTMTAKIYDLEGSAIGGPLYATHHGVGATEHEALEQARARALRGFTAEAIDVVTAHTSE